MGSDRSVSLYSGTGLYGNVPDAAIPDTPLDEWSAGIETLLAECAAWEQQAEAVLENEPPEDLPWVAVAPERAGWVHVTRVDEPATDVWQPPLYDVCDTLRPEPVCRCGMYRLVWE